MCLHCAPAETGGEEKVLAAAAAVRAVNPDAAIIFYFAVDYTRRWYDLGVYFDAHPDLEVHNADGSLAEVHQHDDGTNTWHVFDFGKPAAVAKWVADIAQVVKKGNLQGVFIDGYRGGGDAAGSAAWIKGLIPDTNGTEAAAWVAGAWNSTGVELAKAIPNTIRLPNGNSPTVDHPPPGYNAISIEFFGTGNIADLIALGKTKVFVEVHSYIGDNAALFNSTLAAYLVCCSFVASRFGLRNDEGARVLAR
jgi:hypothetical protein